MRHALIVAEVALALVLLAGAGFFVRGLQRFAQRDAGWRTDSLLTGQLSLRGQNYATTAARGCLLSPAARAARSVARQSSVSAIGTSLPTSGYDNSNSFVVEGQPPPAPARRRR